MLSYTISNYRMTQFWRVLTQSHTLLVLLYHSQEMWVALVKKQTRAQLGSLTQNPTAGSAGILCTIAAQNTENHGYHYWYMFGIGKTALKIGVSFSQPEKEKQTMKK